MMSIYDIDVYQCFMSVPSLRFQKTLTFSGMLPYNEFSVILSNDILFHETEPLLV